MVLFADESATISRWPTSRVRIISPNSFVLKPLIIDSIKMLWDYEIIVDPESYNLQRNLNNWIWLDKKGEIPIDEDDDCIDAGRYYMHRIIKPGIARKGNRIL